MTCDSDPGTSGRMDEPVKPEFQLRRIGKPATVPTVKDVFRLTKDVTRFGRHSGNDQFLDSALLNHFISRWHAEIHRVEIEGETRFIVRDSSLNGTYINHVRVKGNCMLKEGDVVLFGHTNGKHIKPGQCVMQKESEFKFVFEEVQPPPANVFIDLSTDDDVELTAPASPVIPLVGPTDRQTPYSSSQETPSSQSSRPSSVSRRLLPGNGNSIVLKDISNTGLQPQGLVSLDTLIPRNCLVQNHENEVDDMPVSPSIPSSMPAHVTQAVLPSDLLIPPLGTSSTSLVSTSESVMPVTTSVLELANQQPIASPQMPDSTQDVVVVEDEVINQAINSAAVFCGSGSEDDMLNISLNLTPLEDHTAIVSSTVISSTVAEGIMQPVILTEVPSACSTPTEVTTINKANRLIPATPVAAPPRGSAKSTPVSSGRGKRSAGKKTITSASKVSEKRRNSNSSVTTDSADKKRKKGQKWAQPKAKKSKFALPTDEDRQNMTSDDEDWYRWHTDGDMCASPGCTRPSGLKVDWVQCDSCDEWYHTVCAGCNFSELKDEDAEFHCGCK